MRLPHRPGDHALLWNDETLLAPTGANRGRFDQRTPITLNTTTTQHLMDTSRKLTGV
ncbi:hypothetical protein [Streptomyces mirabilis]